MSKLTQLSLEEKLRQLRKQHNFDTFNGRDFGTLFATRSMDERRVKLQIPLRNLFFDTDFEITLVSKRKIKNICNLWRIPKGYQRHFVKTEKQQQQLLLALLRGEVDSQFIFGVTPTTFNMDVIDSQQRLTIWKRFFNNKLALPKKAILRFIGHDEGTTMDCSEMYYDDFKQHPIFELLMDTILDGVVCETVIYEGPVSLHVAVFNALNTGNTSLSDMESITSQPFAVFQYARDFNNFGISYKSVDDDNWIKLNKLWELTGLNGKRYEQCKLVLQCVCFEKYGWNSNITTNQINEFAKNGSISKSWKDIFDIFTKLHTDVIKEKSDYYNKDLWGLQGWRIFLSFIRFLYKQEESVKIVVKDYVKFWEFAQDIMKNLRTTMGKSVETGEFNFDLMKAHPVNNKKLILGLVVEFEKFFSNAKSHDDFLKTTGISVRDGNRVISWKNASFIWQLQDGKCAGCGVSISVNDAKDHILEWSKGGKSDVFNAQILCKPCHDTKTKTLYDTNDISDDDTDEFDD